MAGNWRDWNTRDLLYGIVAPVAVVLLIVGLWAANYHFGGFGGSGEIITGIVMMLEELTVIAAVPLMLGLVWNKWAGGASGFLMGTLYALTWASSVHGRGAGIVLLAYILSPMLIGYIGGALNKGSEDFRRMLISGVIATTIGGVALFGIFQLWPSNVVLGWDGLLLNVLPRMLCGVLVPVVAKVFFWYGLNSKKKM